MPDAGLTEHRLACLWKQFKAHFVSFALDSFLAPLLITLLLAEQDLQTDGRKGISIPAAVGRPGQSRKHTPVFSRECLSLEGSIPGRTWKPD